MADNRCACLLANHGVVCYSKKSISDALGKAIEIESLAK